MKLRRHPRARRISLRIDPETREVILTLPRHASEKQGFEFMRSKSAWLERQLATLPRITPLVEGISFPLLGESVSLIHAPGEIGLGYVTQAELRIPGPLSRWRNTLEKTLLSIFRNTLEESIAATLRRLTTTTNLKPETWNLKPKLRRMRSRWGSCGPDGALTFNSCLLFAPRFVVDYVVAHELAHLRYRSHGKHFWMLVEQLYPRMEEARQWLRRHGHTLYQWQW